MSLFEDHPKPWRIIEDCGDCGYGRKSAAIVDNDWKIKEDLHSLIVVLNPSESEYVCAMTKEEAKTLVKFINECT